MRLAGEQRLGGGEEAGALARRQRFGRRGEARAGFDLDQREQPVARGGDVDLARTGAQAPAEDGPALRFERGGGQALGIEAASVRALAAGAAGRIAGDGGRLPCPAGLPEPPARRYGRVA